MKGYKNRTFMRIIIGGAVLLLPVVSLLIFNRPTGAETPAETGLSSPETAGIPPSISSASGFHPNHRVTDAGRRSFWAHTFSSGAHSVVVRGREVFAAWYDVRNGDSDAFFAKSVDGGATFGPNIRVNDDTGHSRQYKPSLGLDAAGRIYLIWRDDRRGHADIFFARSEDGGKTFTKNLRLNDDTGWAYQGNPSIGVSPEGIVYAAWSDDRNGQGDIYFTVSRNQGKSFGRNLRLNDDSKKAVQSHPTVGVGSGGLVVVAWEDFRNGRSEIYLARSTDEGRTFEANRRVVSGGKETIQVSPSIAVDPNGRVAVAWAQFRPHSGPAEPPDAARGETLWWDKVRQGDADIQLAVSPDGGVHFGPPIQVNDDRTSRAQAFPSVAFDPRGGIDLAWEDFRNGQADIYFAQLGGSQVALRPNQKVNDDSSHALQYHPSLAVDEQGRAYILWTDGRGNPFVKSDDADAHTEEEGNEVYFASGP